MIKSFSNNLTLILALIGCALTTLLMVEHYTHVDIGCTKAGEGCAATLNSAYGQFTAFGISIPTAAFGLGMYLVIAILCVLRGKQLKVERDREAARAAAYAVSGVEVTGENAAHEASFENRATAYVSPTPPSYPAATQGIGLSVRLLDRTLWGIALLGICISVWLQYVAIYQLESFCKYCFASATLVTLIFLLTSRDHLLDGRKLTGEQKMLGAVVGFILLMGSFIVVPQIIEVATHHHKIDAGPVSVTDKREVVMNPLLHTKGSPKAKFTLVEFADYMCGHCALAAPVMENILKKHSKDLRIGFRNFPLPNHRSARQAALAAEAAGEQGKFWEMHDLLFLKQTELESPSFTDADFDKYATVLKLNIAKFDSDRTSGVMEERVNTDSRAGEKTDVGSTPSFFFVTPTQVTKFAGIEELKKFAADPKNWQ